MPVFILEFDTPFGKMAACRTGGFITHMLLPGDARPDGGYAVPALCDRLLDEAAAQMKAYFEGKLTAFSLPLNPRGAEFMRAVWDVLLKIPYGRTSTYGEVAAAAGRPKAARAAGQANNKNPIAVVIPCHRVLGANGRLTGYRGGLQIKERLLELERSVLNNAAAPGVDYLAGPVRC